MSGGRVFFYVQHLLGIGHLRRAARLSGGLSAAGFQVDLVMGGMPVGDPGAGGARLVQLPPARSVDGRFSALADADGAVVDERWLAARRDRLLAEFRAARPDVLVIETYPFGRRQMRFELDPLLAAAEAMDPRPVVLCSVRDIVQAKRKPGRAEETAALVHGHFDAVLVHGDPNLVRFDESYPLAREIAGKLHYTGYVAPAHVAGPRTSAAGRGEVLVSAGGGAVGRELLDAAIAARPLTGLADATWRLLLGPNFAPGDVTALRAAAGPGIIVELARPDFPERLAECAVSISQAGYNTVVEILWAEARAVLVPFAGDGESEQPLRAARLADRGLATAIDESGLDPARLAKAIDAAVSAPRPLANTIDLDGSARSARFVEERLAGRTSTGFRERVNHGDLVRPRP